MTDFLNDSPYLEHHGILGMKWRNKKGHTTTNADNELRRKIAQPAKSGNTNKGFTDKQLKALAYKWSPSPNNSVNKLLNTLRRTNPKEFNRLFQALLKYNKSYWYNTKDDYLTNARWYNNARRKSIQLKKITKSQQTKKR